MTLLELLTDAPVRVAAPRVISTVARRYNFTPAELCGPSRKQRLVAARHVAMALCHSEAQLNYEEIGRAFGGRHHATTSYAVAKVQREREQDVALDQELTALVAMLAELPQPVMARRRRRMESISEDRVREMLKRVRGGVEAGA